MFNILPGGKRLQKSGRADHGEGGTRASDRSAGEAAALPWGDGSGASAALLPRVRLCPAQGPRSALPPPQRGPQRAGCGQQPVTATLFNRGVWKRPEDAEAPVTGLLGHLARFAWRGRGAEPRSSLCSSSPQREPCEAASEGPGEPGKGVHGRHAATSKGLFVPPVSGSHKPGALLPSASPLLGTPRAARGSGSPTSHSGWAEENAVGKHPSTDRKTWAVPLI